MNQYPPITPMFAVSDYKASIAWFEKLGFELIGDVMTMPDGSLMHAEMTRGDARIMLDPPMRATGASGLELYMKLDDGIDDLYARVQASGVEIAQPIRDEFWGDRIFTVAHPDGYRIMFAQTVRTVTMEEMKGAMEAMAPVTA